jgi:hypothetical protein
MYDFPSSPTPGQEYTPPVGGQTYVWQSPRWLVKGIPPTGIATAYVSATAPGSPVPGLIWWNSTTKELNIWDGTAWQIVVGTWA